MAMLSQGKQERLQALLAEKGEVKRTCKELARVLSDDGEVVTPRSVSHYKQKLTKSSGAEVTCMSSGGRPKGSRYNREIGAALNELILLTNLSASALYKRAQVGFPKTVPKMSKSSFHNLLGADGMRTVQAPADAEKVSSRFAYQLTVHSVCLGRAKENQCVLILGAYECVTGYLRFKVVSVSMHRDDIGSSKRHHPHFFRVHRNGDFLHCFPNEKTIHEFIREVIRETGLPIEKVIFLNGSTSFASRLADSQTVDFGSSIYKIYGTRKYLRGADFGQYSVDQIAMYLEYIQNTHNQTTSIPDVKRHRSEMLKSREFKTSGYYKQYQRDLKAQRCVPIKAIGVYIDDQPSPQSSL